MTPAGEEGAAAADRLATELAYQGHLADPLVREAMARVQRHRFLPEQVWIDDDRADGGYRSVDRRTDPDLWWNSAYGNVAVVTQVEDGLPHRLDPHWITPTSSASLPSAVAQMAAAAELTPGLQVLEIGAATGYNLALISEIVGQGHAVGVEIGPALATNAGAALHAAGYQKVTVVTGDGQQGYVPGAPYDRIVSTAAVMSVPLPWVNQTRPGGMILTPFATTLCGQGMVLLRVDEGQAVGHFTLPLEFMLVRGQRRSARFDELFTDEVWAASRVHRLAVETEFLDNRDACSPWVSNCPASISAPNRTADGCRPITHGPISSTTMSSSGGLATSSTKPRPCTTAGRNREPQACFATASPSTRQASSPGSTPRITTSPY